MQTASYLYYCEDCQGNPLLFQMPEEMYTWTVEVELQYLNWRSYAEYVWLQNTEKECFVEKRGTEGRKKTEYFVGNDSATESLASRVTKA